MQLFAVSFPHDKTVACSFEYAVICGVFLIQQNYGLFFGKSGCDILPRQPQTEIGSGFGFFGAGCYGNASAVQRCDLLYDG